VPGARRHAACTLACNFEASNDEEDLMGELREKRAKAAGFVRGASAVLKGRRGIFKRLTEEHGEITSLMKQIARAESDIALRKELFPQIKSKLLAHAKAEESEFYSRLHAFAETRDLVRESASDHHAVEQLLERLEAMEFAPPSWLELFREMRTEVERHIDQEEHRLFPLAEKLIAKEDAEDIERRYVIEEQRQLRMVSSRHAPL
jgi:hemerythrin superfamily protein